MCPFDYTAFAVSGKVGIPLTGLTTPVGLLVTPTDRPKSVRNRCVIEVFGGVCVCCPLVFEFSVGIGGFVIGLGQISFFFSVKYILSCGSYDFTISLATRDILLEACIRPL